MTDLKVAYPKDTDRVLKMLADNPLSRYELQQLPYGNIILDDLMKFGLVNRILVKIEGVDYIYLESAGKDVTFIQGRREFARIQK